MRGFGSFIWPNLSSSRIPTAGCNHFSNGSEPDISCLRSLKDSFEDPQSVLSSWNFNDNTAGFICRFTGVECWKLDENKVMNIRLSNMGLKGVFPRGLANCTRLTGLDLSGNSLSGPLPSDISKLLSFVTSLYLSSNSFTGKIPRNIANCTYLNVLRLENNKLSGQIPPEMSQLLRLKDFSVANNRLSGPVPDLQDIPIVSYLNNTGLCGVPLEPCKRDEVPDLFISGFGVGYAVFSILAMLFAFFYLPSMPMKITACFVNKKDEKKEKKQELIHISSQISRMNDAMEDTISLLENSASRMSLSELRNATNDFNSENIISRGRIGTIYKATLPNGWSLAIRRLHDWYDFDQFVPEILTLGRTRHRNVVPLLGFCFELTEKVLVHAYMPNSSLHELLHSKAKGGARNMQWTSTFKIAIGIARGLSWLHHNNIFQAAHLNLRPKYTLLDQNLEPKISNFGCAKFAKILVNQNTNAFTRWNFLADNKVLDTKYLKKDVYSFGMVLLELITGKEPSEMIELSPNGDIVDWVTHFLGADSHDEFFIRQDHDEERLQLVKIAFKCIAPSANQRPQMLEVYEAIQAIREQDTIYSDA